MDSLQQFYTNEIGREAVRQFLLQTVNELALESLYKGEDAKPIAEARKVVEKAFANLQEMFEPKQQPNIINKAR